MYLSIIYTYPPPPQHPISKWEGSAYLRKRPPPLTPFFPHLNSNFPPIFSTPPVLHYTLYYTLYYMVNKYVFF